MLYERINGSMPVAAINLFPQINKLADKAVIALARSPVCIQLVFGGCFKADGGSYLQTTHPYTLSWHQIICCYFFRIKNYQTRKGE